MRSRILDFLFLIYIVTVTTVVVAVMVMALDPGHLLKESFLNVLNGEWVIHQNYVLGMRNAYPHLYILRIAIDVGLLIVGFYYIVYRLISPPLQKLLHQYSEWMNRRRNRYLSYVSLSILMVVCILLLEVGLRIAGVYHPYRDVYDVQEKTFLHIHGPNRHFEYENEDFIQRVNTNSRGLVDKEWPLSKHARCRLATIGDSFTEGVGTVADSSYPRLLAGMLHDTEVLNFGIGGSDPVFGYLMYKNLAFHYHPDIVTMTINQSDIHDIRFRGGFERFGSDGQVHYRAAHWWELLYNWSVIFRVFLHYHDPYLASTHERRDEVLAHRHYSLAIIEQAIDSFEVACRTNGAKAVLIFHPMVSEFMDKHMDCDPAIDYARSKGYKVLDMRRAFLDSGIDSSSIRRYFWLHDGHNNGTGYAVMARAVRDSLFVPENKLLSAQP